MLSLAARIKRDNVGEYLLPENTLTEPRMDAITSVVISSLHFWQIPKSDKSSKLSLQHEGHFVVKISDESAENFEAPLDLAFGINQVLLINHYCRAR